MSVSTVIMLQIISIFLFFFWWFFHLENWIEYDMFPNNRADFFLCINVHLLTNLIFRRSGGALRKHENFDIIWMFMQCGLKMLKLCNEYLKCIWIYSPLLLIITDKIVSPCRFFRCHWYWCSCGIERNNRSFTCFQYTFNCCWA